MPFLPPTPGAAPSARRSRPLAAARIPLAAVNFSATAPQKRLAGNEQSVDNPLTLVN